MNKTVAFLTMEKADNRQFNSVGSSRIRARWLLLYWEEAEEYMIGRKYETIIFQKVYWDTFKDKGDFKGIKIIDICDPDWLEGKPVFEFIDWADATVTSSPTLRDYIKQLRPNSRVVCIPDRVYLPEYPPRGKHESKATKVGWFGYHQNIHYLQRTFDEIIKHNLELTIICEQEYTPPITWRTLRLNNVPFSYPGVNDELKKLDFVIFPETVTVDERGKYKSNNKTLQTWALGLPVATTPEEMERFMDPVERNKEQELRLKEIATQWDVKLSVEEYRKLIEEIKKDKV